MFFIVAKALIKKLLHKCKIILNCIFKCFKHFYVHINLLLEEILS
jgi:hypothetical protein